nr:MAG TPA: hypothetical protein [Caudoviricetes sp.]
MSRWTHGLTVIMQETLLGIYPGKVFFLFTNSHCRHVKNMM